jgi:hypothetical protein
MVAGLEVTARCLVFVCQGEGGGAAAWRTAGPPLACCLGELGRPGGDQGGGAGLGGGGRRSGIAACRREGGRGRAWVVAAW